MKETRVDDSGDMKKKRRKRDCCPCLVLAEEEGQQHQHPAVMDDPPDINVALCVGLTIIGKQRDVLGHQQGQVGCRGHPHCVWKRGGAVSVPTHIQDL